MKTCLLLLICCICGGLLASGASAKSAFMRHVHRIVFIGDSLTDCAAWTEWVVETLKVNGYPELEIHSAGIGGEAIADIKKRLAIDVLALHPDLVIMQDGTNDTGDAAKSAAYQRDYTDVVKAIRATKAKMVLLTSPPTKYAGVNNQLTQFDGIVRGIAKRYHCRVAETRRAFDQGIAAGKPLLVSDGVHHTYQGWQVMARAVLDALDCHAPVCETVSVFPDAITAWRINVTIPYKFGDPLPAQLASTTFDATGTGWTPYDGAARATADWYLKYVFDRGGIFPLGEPKRKDAIGAFAVASVHVDQEGQYLMRVGGSPFIIWVNGEKVRELPLAHGFHPDAIRFPVHLQQGDNRLFVYNAWFFHLSLEKIRHIKG